MSWIKIKINEKLNKLNIYVYIDGLVQDCSNSIANALDHQYV